MRRVVNGSVSLLQPAGAGGRGVCSAPCTSTPAMRACSPLLAAAVAALCIWCKPPDGLHTQSTAAVVPQHASLSWGLVLGSATTTGVAAV